jgi:hypothetical protein
MKTSWKLLKKIEKGEKIIESRWYTMKKAPWDIVHKGDTIYFKNSGEFVTIKAKVAKVLQFSNLNPEKINKILREYGKDDGISEDKIPYYFELFKEKKYCILMYLKNVKKIEPFEINKKGFGAMSAWISIPDIKLVKK